MALSYINLSKNYWEKEYKKGYNDVLNAECETLRYTSIAEIICSLPNHNTILDIGCGTGILEKFLPYDTQVSGIDVSEEAIQIARNTGKGKYLMANAESYVPTNKYDVILFNEVLYYFSNPEIVMKRYMAFLNVQGNFVVSIYNPNEGHQSFGIFQNIIDMLPNWGFKIIKKKQIVNGKRYWQVFVLKGK